MDVNLALALRTVKEEIQSLTTKHFYCAGKDKERYIYFDGLAVTGPHHNCFTGYQALRDMLKSGALS